MHSCFVFLRGELTEKNDLHSCTARLHMLNSSSAIAMSKVLLVVDRPNSRPGNGLVQGSSILSTELGFSTPSGPLLLRPIFSPPVRCFWTPPPCSEFEPAAWRPRGQRVYVRASGLIR